MDESLSDSRSVHSELGMRPRFESRPVVISLTFYVVSSISILPFIRNFRSPLTATRPSIPLGTIRASHQAKIAATTLPTHFQPFLRVDNDLPDSPVLRFPKYSSRIVGAFFHFRQSRPIIWIQVIVSQFCSDSRCYHSLSANYQENSEYLNYLYTPTTILN